MKKPAKKAKPKAKAVKDSDLKNVAGGFLKIKLT